MTTVLIAAARSLPMSPAIWPKCGPNSWPMKADVFNESRPVRMKIATKRQNNVRELQVHRRMDLMNTWNFRFIVGWT